MISIHIMNLYNFENLNQFQSWNVCQIKETICASETRKPLAVSKSKSVKVFLELVVYIDPAPPQGHVIWITTQTLNISLYM